MKNKTIAAAIEMGFDFAQFDNETELKEVFQAMFDFLNENIDKLEKTYDECEVTGNGSHQNVNHIDYTSSGKIIDWSYYYGKPRQKAEHSEYLYIDTDGTPLQMVLWCWSMTEQQEKEMNEDWSLC